MDSAKLELEEKLASYKILKEQGFHFVARSQSGELKAFIKNPEREINFWWVKGELPHPIDGHILENVDWRDLEPVNIAKEIKMIKKTLKSEEKG